MKTKGRPDFLLFTLTLVLVFFGLLMIYSASSKVTIMDSRYNYDSLYFFKKQMTWILAGVAVMFTAMKMNYHFFRKMIVPLMLLSITFLVLVLFIGSTINGAQSWINLGPMSFQPTEFAKIVVLIYLANIISKKEEKFLNFKVGLLPVLLVIAFYTFLIYKQPDLGACLILLLASAIIIFVGGASFKHVITLGGIGVIGAVAIAMYFLGGQGGYRSSRFTAFLNPLGDPTNTGYQLLNSYYALGHGGVFGTGFGDGVQKIVLPFSYNDFILAVVGEEFGFVGITVFLLVYFAFILRGIQVSLRSKSNFGMLLGIGISSLIAVQAVINIGGVVGLMPITGVTLPLISYGGTSLLITMFSLGILLSISRDRDKEVKETKKTTRTKKTTQPAERVPRINRAY
ncbi:cell division protein FtsW [Paenibacillus phyllosphaerae]|uniref:Probable peptidoglycan glycosyltransferase FtsW n=1 Tax=Paenibacillus phyllosphaerae TaxID=274593 RepID=A0A7W5AWP5_9BACL|nr:putative lipid II flippase FtsW [Paenibacillus phyllosphaerae]MBB3110077.1 cell division protein FtsW [Paenibacillus phyllosphaerae]